jgi:hypothetical protein
MADQSIQTIEAKALLLFGFRAQLRSPSSNFLRQLGFPHCQLPYRIFCLRWFHQSVPCSSESACSIRQGPLAPGSFEPFLATMGPSDSHFRQPPALLSSAGGFAALPITRVGLPSSCLFFEVRAARLYPGKSSGWLQSSFQPLVLASHLLNSLATFIFEFRGFRCRFACAAARTSASRGFSRLVTFCLSGCFSKPQGVV